MYCSTTGHQAVTATTRKQAGPLSSEVWRHLIQPSRTLKRVLAVSMDIASALLSLWLAVSLRFDAIRLPDSAELPAYLLAPLLMLPVFTIAGMYRAIYRYSGFAAYTTVVKSVVAYGILFLCALVSLHRPELPLSLGIMQPMILLLLTGGTRAIVRMLMTREAFRAGNGLATARMLIYGAGAAGVEMVNAIHRSPKYALEGFIDDDTELQGRTINGMMVYSPDEALELITERGITNILLAIPSASRSRRNGIIEQFRSYPVHIETLPGVDALADGKVTISDIKEIEIEDLLGRDPVPVNHVRLQTSIAGRVVMVTGAGGSIGSELCRQLLAAHPAKILLFDNSEHNLYTVHTDLMQRSSRFCSATELLPLLGDITDEHRIRDIFRVFRPDLIYHAAAFKHVPMVEHNPTEGLRNNVFGTLTLAVAAVEYHVSRVVLVSTDKAVRPTNIMGASKRLCEMIFQALASEADHDTCFSMVRFGNVLGSSGSVVPLFRRQIREGGPITITHKEISRYFMTIPEAAQLVIQAGAMAAGGEVYLLDMGEPIKIMDMARRMIELSGLQVNDIEIRETGLRPGEKLYEELLISNDAEPTSNARIFKANEQYCSWEQLQDELDYLGTVLGNNDVDAIKSVLKKLIPEYQPDPLQSDLLAIEQSKQCQHCA